MSDIKPFSAALSEMSTAGASLMNSDWSSIYMMMEKFNEKPDDLPRFSEDPQKYCTENGFPLPKGVGIISYKTPQGLAYVNPKSEKPTASGVRVMAEMVSPIGGVCLVCIICGECSGN